MEALSYSSHNRVGNVPHWVLLAIGEKILPASSLNSEFSGNGRIAKISLNSESSFGYTWDFEFNDQWEYSQLILV